MGKKYDYSPLNVGLERMVCFLMLEAGFSMDDIGNMSGLTPSELTQLVCKITDKLSGIREEYMEQ